MSQIRICAMFHLRLRNYQLSKAGIFEPSKSYGGQAEHEKVGPCLSATLTSVEYFIITFQLGRRARCRI